MDLDVIKIINDHKNRGLLLEDVLAILKKLGDESTYRINEASPEMALSISNLEAAIERQL